MHSSTRRTFLTSSTAAAVATQSVAMSATHADRPIRIGQIGTKHAHASGKLATLRKYPELFDVVGIAEADSNRWKDVSSKRPWAGLPKMTEEQLLATPGLEAVTVETDIDELLPTAERCVASGMHIHLDKPAGTSLPHFRRICQAANRHQTVIQMGYMFRSNPAFRFAFEAVRNGWLGEIFQVHCEMSKKISDDLRAPMAQYAGGSMFELGCHLIDAVVTVLGPPQRVTAFNRNSRPNFDKLMDTCLSVFEYPNATASVRSSLCEVNGGQRRQFVVCGTRGTIVIQPLEPFHLTLTLESAVGGYGKGIHVIKLPRTAGRYDGDLQHFAAAIRGTEPAEYDTAHDVAVQETVLQASGMAIDSESAP